MRIAMNDPPNQGAQTVDKTTTQDPTLFVGGASGRIVVDRSDDVEAGLQDSTSAIATSKLPGVGGQTTYDVGQGTTFLGVAKSMLLKHESPKAALAAKKRKSVKKPDGKPKRPLSAYNLFFHQERKRLLGDEASDFVVTDQNKRRHRKTHGKIGFAEMAKRVSQRWNKLSAEEKKPFEELASKEKDKYKTALSEWKNSQEYQDFQTKHAEELSHASNKEPAITAAADRAEAHQLHRYQPSSLQRLANGMGGTNEHLGMGSGQLRGTGDFLGVPQGNSRLVSAYGSMTQFGASNIGGGGPVQAFSRGLSSMAQNGTGFAGGFGGSNMGNSGMAMGMGTASGGGVEATRAALTSTYGRMSRDQTAAAAAMLPMETAGMMEAQPDPDERLRRIEESYLRNLAEVSQLREQLRRGSMDGAATGDARSNMGQTMGRPSMDNCMENSMARPSIETLNPSAGMFVANGGVAQQQNADMFGIRGDARSQILRQNMMPGDIGPQGAGSELMHESAMFDRMRGMSAQQFAMIDGQRNNFIMNEQGRIPNQEEMEHMNEALTLRGMRNAMEGQQHPSFEAEAEARRVAVERALDMERNSQAR